MRRPSITIPSLWMACLAIMAVAACYRVYLLATVYTHLDADQAITGIMAAHITAGDRPVFYYGQPYQGSLEAYFVALAGPAFGAGAWVVRAPALLCSVLWVGAVFWLGNLLYSRRVATLSALYVALGPQILIASTTSGGFAYVEMMLCGTLLLILAAGRSHPWPEPLLAAAGGLLAGLGLWLQPLMLDYLTPCAMILVCRLARDLRHGGRLSASAWLRAGAASLAGLAAGAAPLLYYNARHGWATIEYLRARAPGGDHLSALRRMFSQAMPVLAGMVPPTTVPARFSASMQAHRGWYALGVGLGLACIFIVALSQVTSGLAYRRAALARRAALGGDAHVAEDSGKEPREAVLLLFVLCCPLFYVASNFGALPASPIMPRYLAPLYTAAPLVVHCADAVLRRRWSRVLLTPGIVVVILLGLIASSATTLPPAGPTAVAGAAPSPPGIDGLIGLLERQHARIVYTGYWLAYRLSFETGEHLTGIPVRGGLRLGQVRVPGDLDLAEHVPAAGLAWVLDAGTLDERRFRALLRAGGISARRRLWSGLVVYTQLSRALRAPLIDVPRYRPGNSAGTAAVPGARLIFRQYAEANLPPRRQRVGG